MLNGRPSFLRQSLTALLPVGFKPPMGPVATCIREAEAVASLYEGSRGAGNPRLL